LQGVITIADVVRNSIIRLTASGSLPFEFYTAGSFDPELSMLPILARQLSSLIAIDVGANRGEFTNSLRQAGFEVDAFEPLPNLVADLSRRFAWDRRVRIHPYACSDRDGKAILHIAQSVDPALDTTLYSALETHPAYDGLSFGNGIEVVVRRLDSVLAPQQPYRAGLLKIDTEGHDIAVLKGAKNIEAEALMVEYWDDSFVFNAGATHNRLEDYVSIIDQKRYPIYIVIWRGISRNEFGFIVEPSQTPRGSWGVRGGAIVGHGAAA
jgi:FkbM family methyltransferase